jgi:hypothetical protein
MAQRMQKFQFGGGAVIALVGLALLASSLAFLLSGADTPITINGPPLLFIGALIVLRIGVLMSERYLCSACGEHIERTSTQCPSCDEPLAGLG